MAVSKSKKHAAVKKAVMKHVKKGGKPSDLKNVGKAAPSFTLFGKKPMAAPTSPDQIGSGMGDNLGTNRVF